MFQKLAGLKKMSRGGIYRSKTVTHVKTNNKTVEDANAEAYSKPTRTSTMELFCENSYRLKAVKYFRKKSSIIDVRFSSEYGSAVNVVLEVILTVSI